MNGLGSARSTSKASDPRRVGATTQRGGIEILSLTHIDDGGETQSIQSLASDPTQRGENREESLQQLRETGKTAYLSRVSIMKVVAHIANPLKWALSFTHILTMEGRPSRYNPTPG